MKKSLYKTIYFKNDSGQVLVFVLVVVLVLFMILFAVIVNLRVDIKEVQIEREYESSYAVAEEELFKIATKTFSTWQNASTGIQCGSSALSRYPYAQNFCKYSPLVNPSDVITGQSKCCYLPGLGDNGQSYVVVNKTAVSAISGVTIKKDDVIEVFVRGSTQDLDISWSGANALSVMLICRDPASATHAYREKRIVICRNGTASSTCGLAKLSGGKTINDARLTGAPLDMSTGCNGIGGEVWTIRLRAIGEDATNFSLSGPGLNSAYARMEIIDVRAFPLALDPGVTPAEFPAPMVYVKQLSRNRVSALFDYSLFVADGDVSK